MRTICQSILACATMLFAATSCSEAPKELTLTPASTTLKGDLSDYYEVVDKQYKVQKGTYIDYYFIVVELMRNETPFPFDADDVDPFGRSSSGKDSHAGFGIEVFDEQGEMLFVRQANEIGNYEDTEALIKLKNNETGFISLEIDVDEQGIKTVKTFKISSALELGDDASTQKSKASATSSNNWDAVIDDYEDFIDQYIALLKKAKAGDTDALTEYASMLSKAQDLQTKLTNAQSNLSPTQAARFSKMMTKMASAASTM